jgi:acetyltransferase
MAPAIRSLSAAEVRAHEASLCALLQDAVDSGASIGFLPPLGVDEARAYWREVAAAVDDGVRVLVVALAADGSVTGSGQLDLATRANARHRAEVAKVMVHRHARRQGLGRAVMQALEAEAHQRGRTTLILDTRQGDPSEALYRGLGWSFAGAIPCYARSATGALDGTALYYKLLEG